MFVTINGADYATFNWNDGEVTLGPVLKSWLEGLAYDKAYYRKLLRNWTNHDNTWLTFEWKHHSIARQFKQFFTDWHPSMAYRVLIPNTRPMARKIELEPEIQQWIKDRDLTPGVDYCMGPYLDGLYRDPFPIVFEFKDPDLAMLFKLTWGGNVSL